MSKRGHDFRWKPPDESGPKMPSWKETYRQRCMDRLRDNRFKHILAKRQSGSPKDDRAETESDIGNDGIKRQDRKDKMMRDIQAIMTTEWELAQREDAENKGIIPENIPAPSVDEMIELMEDILEELRQDKFRQSNETDLCEEYVQVEEEELCRVFHKMTAVEVICPICQKECLHEGPSLISCKCGLHIDTEQDSISLKNVSDNLQSGTTEHERQCDQKPSFSQMDGFGISTLVMTCRECDFHYIIV